MFQIHISRTEPAVETVICTVFREIWLCCVCVSKTLKEEVRVL